MCRCVFNYRPAPQAAAMKIWHLKPDGFVSWPRSHSWDMMAAAHTLDRGEGTAPRFYSTLVKVWFQDIQTHASQLPTRIYGEMWHERKHLEPKGK